MSAAPKGARALSEQGAIVDRVRIAPEPSLRSLEARAQAFVLSEIAPCEDEASDQFAVRITRAMGAAGLLEACTGLDIPAICVLRETIARSSGLCDSMLALQGLGYAPIALAGSEAQRARWTDPIRLGQAIAAFALTEPEAGSDVGAIATRAVRDGAGWMLEGTKCFISNAGLADIYVVFARTGEHRTRGLSAFLLCAADVRLVERYALIAPHPSGEIAFDQVRLPAEALIGAEGDGFKLAMATLDRFRCTVGAAAIGMAGRALDEASARARGRVQFGKPIGRFQQIGAAIGESWAELEAARLLVYRAADGHARGEAEAGQWASAAKLLATEVAHRVIDRSVQIHGGLGVRRGTVVERLYREVRALRIYEGSSEIQRELLSRHLLAEPRPLPAG